MSRFSPENISDTPSPEILAYYREKKGLLDNGLDPRSKEGQRTYRQMQKALDELKRRGIAPSLVEVIASDKPERVTEVTSSVVQSSAIIGGFGLKVQVVVLSQQINEAGQPSTMLKVRKTGDPDKVTVSLNDREITLFTNEKSEAVSQLRVGGEYMLTMALAPLPAELPASMPTQEAPVSLNLDPEEEEELAIQ